MPGKRKKGLSRYEVNNYCPDYLLRCTYSTLARGYDYSRGYHAITKSGALCSYDSRFAVAWSLKGAIHKAIYDRTGRKVDGSGGLYGDAVWGLYNKVLERVREYLDRWNLDKWELDATRPEILEAIHQARYDVQNPKRSREVEMRQWEEARGGVVREDED